MLLKNIVCLAFCSICTSFMIFVQLWIIRIILPNFLSFIYLLLLFYHHFFALTRRFSPDLSVARVVLWDLFRGARAA